jgi:hypothetical protein
VRMCNCALLRPGMKAANAPEILVQAHLESDEHRLAGRGNSELFVDVDSVNGNRAGRYPQRRTDIGTTAPAVRDCPQGLYFPACEFFHTSCPAMHSTDQLRALGVGD